MWLPWTSLFLIGWNIKILLFLKFKWCTSGHLQDSSSSQTKDMAAFSLIDSSCHHYFTYLLISLKIVLVIAEIPLKWCSNICRLTNQKLICCFSQLSDSTAIKSEQTQDSSEDDERFIGTDSVNIKNDWDNRVDDFLGKCETRQTKDRSKERSRRHTSVNINRF